MNQIIDNIKILQKAVVRLSNIPRTQMLKNIRMRTKIHGLTSTKRHERLVSHHKLTWLGLDPRSKTCCVMSKKNQNQWAFILRRLFLELSIRYFTGSVAQFQNIRKYNNCYLKNSIIFIYVVKLWIFFIIYVKYIKR